MKYKVGEGVKKMNTNWNEIKLKFPKSFDLFLEYLNKINDDKLWYIGSFEYLNDFINDNSNYDEIEKFFIDNNIWIDTITEAFEILEEAINGGKIKETR